MVQPGCRLQRCERPSTDTPIPEEALKMAVVQQLTNDACSFRGGNQGDFHSKAIAILE